MEHTRLLTREDESHIPSQTVTREDQDNINLFSALHSSLSALEDQLEALRTEHETYTDATQELELADEDDMVPYKIGDAFFEMKVEEVVELLEKKAKGVEEEMEEVRKGVDGRREEMEKLKTVLYAKFGRGINLDV